MEPFCVVLGLRFIVVLDLFLLLLGVIVIGAVNIRKFLLGQVEYVLYVVEEVRLLIYVFLEQQNFYAFYLRKVLGERELQDFLFGLAAKR